MKVNIETERSDLFDVSILIAMRIHIKGKVSEERLMLAFEKAVKSHEILGTKVCIDEDGSAYYLISDDEEKTTGANGISFETSDWKDIIIREERKRFRLEEGEFLKAFVYEMDSIGCKVLFLMHHLGGDGKSLVYFIESFMRFLAENEIKDNRQNGKIEKESGESIESIEDSDLFDDFIFLEDTDSDIDILEIEKREKEKRIKEKQDLENNELKNYKMRTIPAGDLSDKALLDRVGPLAILPKIYNKKWIEDEKKRVFGFGDMDEAYETYWKDRKSVIYEYVISPERVEKILSKCKEWNIGFTAYVTTAYLRRLGRKLDIGFAVDAREDGNRAMGNQATGISIKCAYNYEKSFRQNAEKVQQLMTKKLEDDGSRNFILPFMAAFEPTLVDALNLEHAGSYRSKTSKKLANLLGYGKKTKDLSITNLTRLDIPENYGDLRIDYFSFIPPVISYGKNIIGISTLGKNTVMTIHRVK